jgi:hypothetical protein
MASVYNFIHLLISFLKDLVLNRNMQIQVSFRKCTELKFDFVIMLSLE